MTRAKEFDLLNAPLEGTNLIEASAGTGKTYAISGLFLRLVLEKNLSVNEILVVTFTEAATEELKDRIRTKLREAAEAFATGLSTDPFLEALRTEHRNPEMAHRHLREALRAFDQASIFTIHSFCRRMLYENAFESGCLFDTELVSDQENLKQEVVEDFWRRHFYQASPLFVHYAIYRKLSPDSLLLLLGNRIAQPYLRIIPELKPPESSSQEEAFRGSFKKVCQAWQRCEAEVAKILRGHDGLNRNKYKKAHVALWLHKMDDYLASKGNDPVLFQGFEKFTSKEVQGAAKKNSAPPTHPFFDLCQDLKEKQEALEMVFDQRLLWLKEELFHYAQGELSRRKEEQNIQSFDDLLFKLHRALKKRGGDELARALRRKFKAALIDEFQDTDPIQYGIFKKVFHAGGSTLFLIGDPKQAIYGFRGADIFAYMAAAENVTCRYTLAENWRSEAGLVTAVNAVFSNADQPFLYDRIAFQPTVPATRQEAEPLRLDAQQQAPFQLWFLRADDETGPSKPMNKTGARERISRAVAAEISRLLRLGRKMKALLGKRSLEEGDMAVLVRRNADALLMQEALSALNIPSVLCTTEDLFASHEAMEMERLLAATVEPNSDIRLRAALTTDVMGLRGEGLERLMADETPWEQWIVKFKRYHDLWAEHGFIRMFRRLILEEEVLSRLMSFVDGERRNTNLLHLSEVLHEASVGKKLSSAGLLKWLSDKRDEHTRPTEEHQLRLETDEKAVRLVTIHKSKGLEYPVVFCPFSWDGSRVGRSRRPFTFHNEGDNMRLTLDLGSPEMDEHLVLAEKEQLAENLRLFYVALTRAKSRCYVVWGRFKDAETSAPAYLLHQPRPWAGGNRVKAISERFNGLSDACLLSELEALQTKATGAIRLCDMPLDQGRAFSPSLLGQGAELTCRRFSGSIDRSWQISSFSSLVSGHSKKADLADRDPSIPAGAGDQTMVEAPSLYEEPSGIFAFPKGTKAGTCMHHILEHLDFTQEDPSEMKRLVTDTLREFGFEATWCDTLCTMLKKVLSARLDPLREDFTLSRIGNEERLNELEFYFPLQSISPKKLKTIFQKHGGPGLREDFPEHVEQLHFAPVTGFMKGFIDLVFQFQDRFFLVDWKSNLLGTKVKDYDQGALAVAMEEQFYILQYHLYALALHQYLRLRLPGYRYERHFGGVYYIFLRGVEPKMGPDYGIYGDRPSEELIDVLCRDLLKTP
ncbi:MAG: exodeoxyribonuclease V subunit beta [Thermodesulfobacteriota bacterium]|nr:exodeoxyribonuclease V subunit beta [Thermodesulfobacteriota bacterium]